MKLIAALRLSRATDESTSSETQHGGIDAYVRAYGHTVVKWTEDLDVSGGMPIRQRPDVGPWLTEEHLGEWDGIIGYKLDRLFRSQGDYVDFYRDYCEEHGKVIISAGEHLDTSTEHGKFMADLLVIFAEMERGRMRTRRREAGERLRRALRWGGGRVPYGYEAYKDGAYWYLRLHRVQAAIVRWMAAKVIAGWSCGKVAADLNRRKILTATGKAWSNALVLGTLRNPVLRGYILHWPPRKKDARTPAPEIVRDDAGMPLRREAILKDEIWDKLQAALDRNGTGKTGNRLGASTLLRIVYCAICQRPMYADRHERTSGRASRQYRCAGRQHGCVARGINADWLERMTGAAFLGAVGHVEIMTRKVVRGDNHAREIGEVGRAITELTQDRYVRGVIRIDWDTVMAGLQARHAELVSLPAEPDTIVEVLSGRTFAAEWESRDAEGRRQLMMDAGYQLRIAKQITNGEPMVTVITAWDLDLARRAGLAAEGLPVQAPDNAEGWEWITAPL